MEVVVDAELESAHVIEDDLLALLDRDGRRDVAAPALGVILPVEARDGLLLVHVLEVVDLGVELLGRELASSLFSMLSIGKYENWRFAFCSLCWRRNLSCST